MSPFGPPGGGGGGGGFGPGILGVTPLSFNFGSVAVGGTPGNIVVTVVNNGDTAFDVLTVSVGGAPYTMTGLPAFPKTLRAGISFTFNLVFTPGSAATFNDTLTVTTDGGVDLSPFTGAITGIGTGVAPTLGVTPSTVFFGNIVITKTSAGIVLTLKNIGTADLTLTAIALAGGTSFALSGLPGLPLVMHANDTTTCILKFTPLSLLLINDTLNITTTANSPAVPVSGVGVQLQPIMTLSQNNRQIVFSFSDKVPNVLHKVLDSTNLGGLCASSSALTATLICNGSIWDQPGQEKKLRRVQVFYENIGVGSITATVVALRPSVGADSFDIQAQTINLGSALADLSERSSFFDIQISGEILLLQISRPANGGPLSLIGFLPHFETGGEKVAGR